MSKRFYVFAYVTVAILLLGGAFADALVGTRQNPPIPFWEGFWWSCLPMLMYAIVILFLPLVIRWWQTRKSAP